MNEGRINGFEAFMKASNKQEFEQYLTEEDLNRINE
jgi:hypothetical protein